MHPLVVFSSGQERTHSPGREVMIAAKVVWRSLSSVYGDIKRRLKKKCTENVNLIYLPEHRLR